MVLKDKTDGRRLSLCPKHIWQKKYFRKQDGRALNICEYIWVTIGLVVDPCQHGTEPSVFIKW
jgi:hypothetical protein